MNDAMRHAPAGAASSRMPLRRASRSIAPGLRAMIPRVASLASGGLMNCAAADPVAGWTAVNLATLPLLATAGGALLWMALRRAR